MKTTIYKTIYTLIFLFAASYLAAQTVNEAATVTWPHNTADDPVATYSGSTGDYFKPDHVSLGSNLNFNSVRTSNDITFRTYKPTVQSGSGPENAVSFNVWPVTGLTFTPTNVAFKAQRYGTDGGKIDVVWTSSNGTDVVIATAVIPARDNSGTYTDASYDLSGLTIPASDGECTLKLILYDLGNTKEAGFADIVITGNLEGTVVVIPSYTVTTSVTPEGAGTITSYPVGSEFDEGTELTLTATKNFGFSFSHWADAADQQVSTNNPYTFTVNADTELKAVFDVLNTYSLNTTIDGDASDYMIRYSPEGEMVNDERMYEDGTLVTLTAKNNPILTFTNWGSGETTADLTLTMNENKDVVAVYDAVDYIVGWDFYLAGNSSRIADFYSTDDNMSAALILTDEGGNITSWLDKSTVAAGGYEAAEGAAVNWNNLADKYYYQISFNATDFTDLKVSADMLYNYNVYSVQKCEYSLDGTSFTTLGTYTLNTPKILFPGTFDLPADADNAPLVYIRWIPDYTSSVVGSSSTNDGTTISAIYVTGTKELVNDGVPPVLETTVPANGATGVSASGKVVLNFDEKVKIADGTTATLGNFELEPEVTGRSITFRYVGLDYNTEYTFSLAGSVVSDLTDNTMTDAISFSFTTIDRPVVTKKPYDFIVGWDGDFAAALSAATAASSSGERFHIFFPDGEYNIGSLTGDGNEMTAFTLPNVSLIGQSADGVIIANNPTNEGISITATLHLTSTAKNIYMQDLSLKNKYDYSGTTGRAVALWDQGDRNILKNVKLLSYQDTYYTGDGRIYLENSEIHGVVDFICGGGDLFFNECLIYLEERSGNVITAPATKGDWGYVFSNCTIDGHSVNNGTYRLGRPWSNAPKAVYINTTMKVLPTADGWGDPMNVVPAVFAEYNSLTAGGSPVDLSNRRTTYTKDAVTVTLDPVLTASEAATYTIDNVLGGTDTWEPTLATEPAPVPVIALNEEMALITWDDSDYVMGWAVFWDGMFEEFVTTNSYNIPQVVKAASSDIHFTVRAANEMGGLGQSSNEVIFNLGGVEETLVQKQILRKEYYSLTGSRILYPERARGVIIERTIYTDGSSSTKKDIRLDDRPE